MVQQNNTLIEEMLYLIIMLVGEFRPAHVSANGGWGEAPERCSISLARSLGLGEGTEKDAMAEAE